jgi:hypothetical protein
MVTRLAALVYGIAFLLVGTLGFVPGINVVHGDHPNLVLEGPGHGFLLGIFHVNVLHNIVHLLFGALGVACVGSFAMARGYFRFVAVAYALLAILGIFPVVQFMFGFIPIEGADVFLHAGLAVVAGYFGFIRKPDPSDLGSKTIEADQTETRETPQT